MAILYVTEYAEMAIMQGGRLGQIPQEPPLAAQVVAIGAGSVQSAAFNSQTQFVRLHSDVAANFLFGTNPTVTKDVSGRMSAGQTEYHGVPRGLSYKVATIAPTV